MCRKSQLNFLVQKQNEDSRINTKTKQYTKAIRNERILKNGTKSKLCLQNLWSADSNCLKSSENNQHGTIEPAIHQTIEPANHRTSEPSIHRTSEPSNQRTTEPPVHRTIEPTIHRTSKPLIHRTFKPESNVASDINVQNTVRSDVTGDLVYSAPAHWRSTRKLSQNTQRRR